MLHLHTENAETIIKAVHMVMHTVSIICMAKLAYKYHQSDPKSFTSRSAQILVFIWLANQSDRHMQT